MPIIFIHQVAFLYMDMLMVGVMLPFGVFYAVGT